MDEVGLHLQKFNPHVFAITERNIPYNRSLSENLLDKDPDLLDYQIPGYKIILPKSWTVNHKAARIMLYVKDDLNFKLLEDKITTEIPSIWIDIGKGKQKVRYCAVYREWTGLDKT